MSEPTVKRATRRRGRPYTVRSLVDALTLHGIDFLPPDVEHGRRRWRVTTGTGTHEWLDPEVFAFCCGLAMGKVKR